MAGEYDTDRGIEFGDRADVKAHYEALGISNPYKTYDIEQPAASEENSGVMPATNSAENSGKMVKSPVSVPEKTGGVDTRFKQGAKPGPGRPKKQTPTVLLNAKVSDEYLIQTYLDAIEIAREQKSAGRMVSAADSLANRKWGLPERADEEQESTFVALLMSLRQRNNPE